LLGAFAAGREQVMTPVILVLDLQLALAGLTTLSSRVPVANAVFALSPSQQHKNFIKSISLSLR
jgi:hypothetical protein